MKDLLIEKADFFTHDVYKVTMSSDICYMLNVE